jgi:hypothetical protein
LEACNTGPDKGSDSEPIPAQWCLPFRRQHDGSFDSGSEADNSGVISEEPKMSNRKVADVLRTAKTVYCFIAALASHFFVPSDIGRSCFRPPVLAWRAVVGSESI